MVSIVTHLKYICRSSGHIIMIFSFYFQQKYVTAKAFQATYNWMITTSEENKTITKENVLDLYSVATYLGINSLEQQCWTFMENDKIFTEDTAFAMYLKAKERNLASIADMMVSLNCLIS